MFSDIRHSLRLLARTPLSTAVALLSIAITVGAIAVVFTAIKSVLIEPLPYASAGELVQLRTEDTRYGKSLADWIAWADAQDVIRSNRSFESVGIFRYSLMNFSGDGSAPPEALYGLAVTASVFPTLGVQPMLGRNILPGEDRPHRAAEMILSYGLWVRRFNSNPNIIGRTVEANGHPCTIIGVMPPGFDFPMRLATTVRTPSQHMDFWTALNYKDPDDPDRTTGSGAVARLRKGVSLAEADQDMKSISDVLARRYPVTNQNKVIHVGRLRDRFLGFAQTGLKLLMAAAAMFLLIGCANVANLLLARALARHRETAVRLALGAGRGRIVRQFLVESSMLGLAGGLSGYGLAVFAWTLLPAVAPMSIPRLAAARADAWVFVFTLAVSLINGLLFGIGPAIRTAQRDPGPALQETGLRVIGGNRNRLRSALVIGEVAVAVVLVVIGGLLTASFVQLIRTDPGFEPDRILASIIIAAGDQYRTDQRHGELYRHILDSVRTLPDVQQAGTVDALPFSGENNGGDIGTGETDSGHVAEIDRVSADYLQTFGVPLREGRWFGEDDMDAARDTALINDVAARQLWAGESPLGKRFCIYCSNPQLRLWKRVVGVVGSIRHSGLNEPTRAEVYWAAGALEHAQFLVVRTSHASPQLTLAIRKAVAAIDPKQPVFLSATMSTLIGDSIADRRFIMTLLAITGCLALALAAAGIYGVVSYLTSLRTQEIGIRVALGATPLDVQVLIFRQGMWMAALGVAIGVSAALALMRVLASVLLGLTSPDPILIGAVVAGVAITAALACIVPAMRATKIDPMAALRA